MHRLDGRDSRLPPLPAAIQNGLLSLASQQLFLPQIRAESQPLPRKRNHIPVTRVLTSQNPRRSARHHRSRPLKIKVLRAQCISRSQRKGANFKILSPTKQTSSTIPFRQNRANTRASLLFLLTTSHRSARPMWRTIYPAGLRFISACVDKDDASRPLLPENQ
jgi:hypothetical protein